MVRNPGGRGAGNTARWRVVHVRRLADVDDADPRMEA